MKYIKTLVMIILIPLMIGCDEYTSEFPLGTIERSYINKDLIGQWQYISSNPEKNKIDEHKMQVMMINNKEYLLRFIPDTIESIENIILGVGHLTKINNQEFANVRFLNTEFEDFKKVKFIIHKIQVNSDTLIYQGISRSYFEKRNYEINSIKKHVDFIEFLDKKSWDLEYKYVRIK